MSWRTFVQRIRCMRCGDTPLTLSWKVFDDGTRHIRGECSKCDRFVAWMPQTEENVRRADEYRGPAPQRGLFDA